MQGLHVTGFAREATSGIIKRMEFRRQREDDDDEEGAVGYNSPIRESAFSGLSSRLPPPSSRRKAARPAVLEELEMVWSRPQRAPTQAQAARETRRQIYLREALASLRR
ncbi:hypothetical protein HPP92_008148 [Vanilla planifolia]|uniref:Uncharacterized protein n=1 Tax=Vanilla planifolia TaxID=51239 RepID=A0A835V639_VANPL|nr:hypothetical protein HPP92_008310 [Vanilla planifolia]KAG0486053.1 hypothetical protein HPP92_008148 [Vanilla planifolia]